MDSVWRDCCRGDGRVHEPEYKLLLRRLMKELLPETEEQEQRDLAKSEWEEDLQESLRQQRAELDERKKHLHKRSTFKEVGTLVKTLGTIKGKTNVEANTSDVAKHTESANEASVVEDHFRHSLSRKQFTYSLFELVDTWTDGDLPSDYVAFIEGTLLAQSRHWH